MTSTLELMAHPRLSFEPQQDGRTEVRFDMRGFGGDIVCSYWPVEATNLNRDPWAYSLERINGKGGTYTHPTENGCKIAIIRHLIDADLIGATEDNAHLDEKNQVIADGLRETREAFTGKPRVGDFVIMPNGSFERCCNSTAHGMQTTEGGSFSLSRSGEGSFSGGLNRPQLWEYFKETGETKLGRFWFFSHNIVGAGRAVDVFLPCRVFKLEPFEMTETEARAHPKAQASAEFWGENHSDHLTVVHKLMKGAA